MKKSKLEKLIAAVGPNLTVSIGGYWTIETTATAAVCTYDWSKTVRLSDSLEFVTNDAPRPSDLNYLKSVLNGYLRARIETITSKPAFL